VSRFITEQLSSVAQLEMLLLLRHDPERTWTPSDVGQSLYTSPEVCAAQLEDLRSRGLLSRLESESRYRYAPSSPELEAVVTILAELYRERRVTVITLIYSKPVDKVQTFADAFKLRREK
jgi:hypothetical protein